MSNAVESQKIADEKKGWKALLVAFILSVLFLGIFYLAMENEPDYMPSKQAESHQTAFKNAPIMSKEALAAAQKANTTPVNNEMSHMQQGNPETHSEHNAH